MKVSAKLNNLLNVGQGSPQGLLFENVPANLLQVSISRLRLCHCFLSSASFVPLVRAVYLSCFWSHTVLLGGIVLCLGLTWSQVRILNENGTFWGTAWGVHSTVVVHKHKGMHKKEFF